MGYPSQLRWGIAVSYDGASLSVTMGHCSQLRWGIAVRYDGASQSVTMGISLSYDGASQSDVVLARQSIVIGDGGGGGGGSGVPVDWRRCCAATRARSAGLHVCVMSPDPSSQSLSPE